MEDPYLDWLGIPKGKRPPTHYQLLGIAPVPEISVHHIEAAMERQLQRLQPYLSGVTPNKPRALEISKEIIKARDTLIDPFERQRYHETMAEKTPQANKHAKSLTMESLCAVIEDKQLIPWADLAQLKARWFVPTRQDPKNVESFCRWLVLNRQLSDFVARVLLKGNADHLLFKQYRIRDRLNDGPMAGSLLATDAQNQQVAIEVMAPEISADTAMLTSIYQVVKRVQKVRHPNVGKIVELGEANGLNYLVKEHYEGDTLDAILRKRGKLDCYSAAQIFSMAFAALNALHTAKVPGGDLKPDCLILTPAGNGRKGARTLKILHAGIRRRAFDNEALAVQPSEGIFENLEIQTSLTFSPPSGIEPEQDMFRLGSTFYHALTGQAPFPPEELPTPTRPAPPVRQLNPQVPEMLAELVEQTIDPSPLRRHKNAGHVAKTLRVFLTAEEELEAQPEQQVSIPPEQSEEEETYKLQGESVTRTPKANAGVGETESASPGAQASMWEQLRPRSRDLLFLLLGAAAFAIFLVFARQLTGMQIIK